MHKGFFSSEIVLKPRWNGDNITIGGLGKDDAREVFGLIQNGIRGLLQKQNNIVQNIVVQNEQKQGHAQSQTLAELEKVVSWFEKGIITQTEFLQLKEKFFAGVSA